MTVPSCIADEESYLVEDSNLRQIIFGLVKEKIRSTSLVLTPAIIRFLALKLINHDQPLTTKIGNVIVIAKSRIRFFARACGAILLGTLAGLINSLNYDVLALTLYYSATENCGYQSNNYFEQLSKDRPLIVYGKESTGHLVIAKDDSKRLIEFDISIDTSIDIIPTGKVRQTKTYKKSQTKAREVQFSDFEKTDLLLSDFEDGIKPEVPQRICVIDETPDIIQEGIE